MLKAMLIYNPAAGQRPVETDLQKAMRYLENRGWQVAWRRTMGPGDATTYGREAVASGYDVAIAAGGDGTIGQVVNGIAGSATALGVLPIGTTNVWARELGIPLTTPLHPQAMQEAVKTLVEGQSRRVDLGMVNGRYFLLWAGIGFDAEVTARVEGHPQTKRRLGQLAFIITALVQTLSLTGVRTNILLDGQKRGSRALLIVVSNIQLYGGIMRIAPQASMNDGLLDICVFKGYRGLAAYRHFLSILFGLHVRDPEVSYHQGRHISITSSRPLPIQADGDIVGATPAEIQVIPQYLSVIMPRHIPSTVLGPESAITRESIATLPNTIAHMWERMKH